VGTVQKVLLTRIGTIEGPAAEGRAAIDWRDNTGPVSLSDTGFDHFHAD